MLASLAVERGIQGVGHQQLLGAGRANETDKRAPGKPRDEEGYDQAHVVKPIPGRLIITIRVMPSYDGSRSFVVPCHASVPMSCMPSRLLASVHVATGQELDTGSDCSKTWDPTKVVPVAAL